MHSGDPVSTRIYTIKLNNCMQSLIITKTTIQRIIPMAANFQDFFTSWPCAYGSDMVNTVLDLNNLTSMFVQQVCSCARLL